MAVLTINRDAVLRTARLDATEASDADAIIVDRQGGIETDLDPVLLHSPVYMPILLLGVTELLAAELLSTCYRGAGESEAFQVGGDVLSARIDHGVALKATAEARLAPFRRRATLAAAPTTEPSMSGTTQAALFGPSEAYRVQG